MKKLLAALVTFALLLSPLTQADSIFANKSFGFLSQEPELMPVDQAFVFDFKQQGNQVAISWVIADGYYLYKDKLKFSSENAELGEIQLPQGVMHHDDYFGEQEVYTLFVDIPIALKQAGKDAQLTVTFMGCAEGKLCFPPTKQHVPLTEVASNDGRLPESQVAPAPTSPAAQSEGFLSTSDYVSEQDGLSQLLSDGNLGWTLLIFFGLGIGLALTPCVFPMYPILSGIIVGQKQKLSTAKAFTLSMAYVQGMAITYSLLGLVVASAGLKYQAALQHPAVLIFLAIMFAVLSLSMFGVYELKLPSRWQDKMNTAANNQQGGKLAGVFMMGVISGLVASPCTTAPLSGALIYVAQTGDLLQGFLALYVLSMGMGLPLLIIGTSGGKLLPKAGQWMDVIKTVFGFLLIAVSIVMLSRIWPGVFTDIMWSLWGISLIGYLMHQNKLTEFNWKQTVRSVLLTLSLLGSFSYGFQAVMMSLGYSSPVTASNANQQQGFIMFKTLDDLNQELATAKAAGQPVLIDFYADWCVACKEFENITFKDQQVQQRFANMRLLKADVTKMDSDDEALLNHYDIKGLPTLLLYNALGQLDTGLTVTGFMGPEAFAQQLDKVSQTN
ncbi:protein-disulfide reductase DsbD [Shewanella sp. NIFS-20-20]|uniref:protein-disulfide reductase DsbD n=1 Tax=Shewanella sp. NIFS-20-20 TaxID=2853806 RepID=UPI001C446E22|nr:protein-disulfide reductase DsbD [Shewanella sp. NIFS-20-20]MBV7317400.1 protein-disulfide reductase DsbD [Shewanella sp. NIFS-20-20]